MEHNDFGKSYDTSLLAYSVLSRLNSGKVDSFSQRLKSQKIQYFAQLFKVSPHYNFNLYVRGPYSPSLARDLFFIKEKNIKPEKSKFIPNELEERFDKLNNFIKKTSSIRELELAATLHWLIKIAKMGSKEAENKLKIWKDAKNEEVINASKLISQII